MTDEDAAEAVEHRTAHLDVAEQADAAEQGELAVLEVTSDVLDHRPESVVLDLLQPVEVSQRAVGVDPCGPAVGLLDASRCGEEHDVRQEPIDISADGTIGKEVEPSTRCDDIAPIEELPRRVDDQPEGTLQLPGRHEVDRSIVELADRLQMIGGGDVQPRHPVGRPPPRAPPRGTRAAAGGSGSAPLGHLPGAGGGCGPRASGLADQHQRHR